MCESYLEKSFSSAPVSASESRTPESSLALFTMPHSWHARTSSMNEISVGKTPSSVCISSKHSSAVSTSSARTNAPNNALYTAALRGVFQRSLISRTISLASIHRPWHPRQCTYAPHITVLGLRTRGFGDDNISLHTSSAASYRPARSAADTKCVKV